MKECNQPYLARRAILNFIAKSLKFIFTEIWTRGVETSFDCDTKVRDIFLLGVYFNISNTF